MGCEKTCPAVPSKKVIEWEVPDPKGKSIEFYREIRDTIEEKVKALLEDID
jgi:protein-tyrosine-phosphatase